MESDAWKTSKGAVASKIDGHRLFHKERQQMWESSLVLSTERPEMTI